MVNPEIARRVMALMAKHTFKRDAIGLDDTLEDLKIDSLAMAEILFDIEEEFEITIDFNANVSARQGVRFGTVREAVAHVEQLLSEPSDPGGATSAAGH
jgi:acyl carrier protein